MTKLTDLLAESDKFGQYDEQPEGDQERPPLATEQKKQILAMVSEYNKFGSYLRSEKSMKEIAQSLGEICEGAHQFVLDEADDWFDQVTINRNMKDLQRLREEFEKNASEGHSVQQRLQALYEDMGVILNRYFTIADAGQQVNETKRKTRSGPNLTETKFYAWYNKDKIEIEATSLWDAKQKAIKQLKVPKSKQGMLAVKSAGSMDKQEFRYEGVVAESKFSELEIGDIFTANGQIYTKTKGEKAIAKGGKRISLKPDLQVNKLDETLRESKSLHEIKIGKYDIGMGYKGNGLTIWDRGQEEHGDYKTIAHIDSIKGLTIRDKHLPSNVKKFLVKLAAEEGIAKGGGRGTSQMENIREEDLVERFLADGLGLQRRQLGSVVGERSERDLAKTLPKVPAPKRMKVIEGPHKGEIIEKGTSTLDAKHNGSWYEYRMNKDKTGFVVFYKSGGFGENVDETTSGRGTLSETPLVEMFLGPGFQNSTTVDEGPIDTSSIKYVMREFEQAADEFNVSFKKFGSLVRLSGDFQAVHEATEEVFNQLSVRYQFKENKSGEYARTFDLKKTPDQPTRMQQRQLGKI